MVEGLMTALSPGDLLALCAGVVVGIVVGALPGLTATLGTALLVPFTFALPPGQGLAMLGGLFVSAMFADAVPAILVNIPGTPAAMTTALDGFPMARQGKAHVAIVAACVSSGIGALFGGVVFLLLAAPLSQIALEFGPPEFFWVGVFALTVVGAIAGDSLLKGLAGGALGMLVGAIGISQTGAVARFTFGLPQLNGGISLVAALVGVFAVPQILEMVNERREHATVARYERVPGAVIGTIVAVLMKPLHLLRSAVLGTVIGILPGAGSPIAAIVSYSEAVRWSRDKQKFGKGAVEGITASEVANTACAPASMIPLIGLGVPGSAPAAIIGGALILHGLQPGPNLFATNSTLVYEFAWLMVLAGFGVFVFGGLTNRLVAQMINVPIRLLAPIILFLCMVGSYALRNNIVDVYMMLGLGLFAYLLKNCGVHPGPIGLGLILGPIVEPALVQAVALAQASSYANVFLSGPVNIALITLTVLSVAYTLWSRRKGGRDDSVQGPRAEEETVAH